MSYLLTVVAGIILSWALHSSRLKVFRLRDINLLILSLAFNLILAFCIKRFLIGLLDYYPLFISSILCGCVSLLRTSPANVYPPLDVHRMERLD
ncbi:hypothetical protein Tco_0268107 [Tanacetum coccineum]